MHDSYCMSFVSSCSSSEGSRMIAKWLSCMNAKWQSCVSSVNLNKPNLGQNESLCSTPTFGILLSESPSNIISFIIALFLFFS